MTFLQKPRACWSKHFLFAELCLVAGLVAAFVAWDRRCGGWGVVDGALKENRGAIYATVASIFGSLLGFVITAVSILLAVIPTERFELLRKSPHHPTLWETYKSAIRSLALATGAAVVALVVDRDDDPSRIAFYFAGGLGLYAVARLARCVWILEKVIQVVTAERSDDSQASDDAQGAES